MPLGKPLASAALPFSMHGVIFANKTSRFLNGVKPFRTDARGRSSILTMAAVSSETAAIGTKPTRVSGARLAHSLDRGLTSAALTR